MPQRRIPPNRFLDEVESRREQRVREFLGNETSRDFGRSLRGLSEQMRVAYRDRFLYELVQNAHDAMPASQSDGRIRIALANPDSEAPFGVVSVANTGMGLTDHQFRALTSLAQSSKPPGQGIGNKGIGFRSVFQVCESPEVYSSDPEVPAAPGYTFRLATDEDLQAMTNDPRQRELLRDLPADVVPIAIDRVPVDVDQAWARGYATVVRLPLRSEQALQATRSALREFKGEAVPVHLFLARVASIDIVSADAMASLTRQVEPRWDRDGASCSLVTLNGAQQFLVTTQTVPELEMRDAIAAAFGEAALTESWRDWKGDARIEAAVALGDDLEQPRTYTFLPLGRESPSPFHGHLNGPFYTDVDRKGLNLSHPLNAQVITWTASLCLTAAAHLRRDEAEFGPRPAVDLVAWRTDSEATWKQFTGAAAETRMDLALVPLFPTGIADTAWSTAENAMQWPQGRWSVLTAAAAEGAGVSGWLRRGLGERRTQRLGHLALALGSPLPPEPATLAESVEAIAGRLHRRGTPIADWDRFYLELAELFRADPQVLLGRRLLLTKGAGLARTGEPRNGDPKRPIPFFPPIKGAAASDDEEIEGDIRIEIPASLESSVLFLHEDLTWHEGHSRLPSREFLAGHKLVLEYRAEDLTRILSAALREDPDMAVVRDAFHLAFAIFSARVDRRREIFRGIGLHVPTRGGWRPATDALFSAAWPGTAGEDLERLASTPAEVSAELNGLWERLLVRPDEAGRGGGERLAEFLNELGVVDALPLTEVEFIGSTQGRQLTAYELPRRVDLPETVRTQWAGLLPPVQGGYGSWTELVAKSPIAVAVGQGDFGRLDRGRKEAFGRLLVRGIDRWDESVLSTSWLHAKQRHHVRTTVTPLSGFIAREDWVPARSPRAERIDFRGIRDAWQYRADETGRIPAQLGAFIEPKLRASLEVRPAAMQRLHRYGLRVWNAPEDAAAVLAYLGTQLAEGKLSPEAKPGLDRELRRTWDRLLSLPEPPHWAEEAPVPVRVGAAHEARNCEALAHARLVVVDAKTPRALRTLLHEYRVPSVEVELHPGTDVVAVLGEHRAVLAQSVEWSVTVDGRGLRPRSELRLVDEFPWLGELVGLLLLHPGAARSPGEELRRSVPLRLDTVVVVRGAVSVQLLGEDRELPRDFRHVLPWSEDDAPAIVLDSNSPELGSWELLESLPSALCEVLRVPGLADRLDSVLLRLKGIGISPTGALPEEDLAQAAGVRLADVRNARAEGGAILDRLWRRTAPLLVHYAGARVLARLAVAPDNETDLDAVVAECAALLPLPTEQFLSLVKDEHDVDGLRAQLGIPLSAINEALARLGWEPIRRDREHREALDARLGVTRTVLQERIRAAFAGELAQFVPVPAWRDLMQMQVRPSTEWGVTLDAIPTDSLDRWIEASLVEKAGRPLPPPLEGVAPIGDVEDLNARFVRTQSGRLRSTVLAWCTEHSAPVPEAWAEAGVEQERLLQMMSDNGALSLGELENAGLVAWAVSLGCWPPSMPATDDPGVLGLTPAAVEQAKGREAEQRRERQRFARLVTVAGRQIDAADIGALTAAADDLVQRQDDLGSDVLTQPRRPMQIARRPAEPPPPINAARGERGPSEDQAQGIGLLGERIAELWFQRHYAYDRSCWVSGIGQSVHPGNAGDDTLGYDFAVPKRPGGKPFYFEVKASAGAMSEVELTEGEVRAAQDLRSRWRLLLVPFVGERPRVIMMPNPFLPETRDLFRFGGKGLRLQFLLPKGGTGGA